jgi:transposase
MAFKLNVKTSGCPDSPEALFHDLRNRKIAGLLAHQADMLREYMKLPGGTGGRVRSLLLRLAPTPAPSARRTGCGQPRVCIGEQTTEQLDLEPARFFVLRTVKKSYACRRCAPATVPAGQRLQTAGPPQVGPIPKGLCGPGLLAHVITAKFADHTPLHRLAGQLARPGVSVARATLGDWLRQAADLLEPLYSLMHQRLLLSRVIHGDDTSVKLRVAGAERTSKAHLWVGIGDADYPYVVFDFTAGYTAAGPERFLDGYRGYLQADALAQYEGLYGDDLVLHVCCWAHARRKFVAAADAKDERAEAALALIRRLYAVERDLPPLLLPSDDPVGKPSSGSSGKSNGASAGSSTPSQS